jgi:hypothetical protein
VFRIPWSARRARTPETWETCVVVLITQRSRVQIPPPLPRPEALSRTEKGPFARDHACRLGKPGPRVPSQ